MPAITYGRVLVTGASGFVGAAVVRAYLERGFSVRATVRSAAKGEFLYTRYGRAFPGRFEYVVVPDLTAPSALDHAVKGVDIVAHIAAPMRIPYEQEEPTTVIQPAVDIVRNMLNSVTRYGTNVRRVVATGSVLSIMEPKGEGYAYTTNDWNDNAVSTIEQNGCAAPALVKLCAAKTLAERALWQFVRQRQGSLAFDVSVILPTWIYGPAMNDVRRLADIGMSSGKLYSLLSDPMHASNPEAFIDSFIDVRDVARLHVDATVREDLGGRRLMAAHPRPLAVQDIYDAFYSLPESWRARVPLRVPRGTPGAANTRRSTFFRFDNATARLVGWNPRELSVVIKDTLDSYFEAGLLPLPK